MEQETRYCKWCGRRLPISEFYLKPKVRIPLSKCKECARKYQRQHYREKKFGETKTYKTKTQVKLETIPEENKKRKCDTCIYRTRVSGEENACYYIMHKGHRRPCKPGNECTEYKKGAPLRLPKHMAFPGVPIR